MAGHSSGFEQQLRIGRIGEGVLATWLRKNKGYSVLPVYEKELADGKGPVLFTGMGELIAPDLLCFRKQTARGNDVIWFEAKTKSAFTWHRITSTWVTGIDLRHYEDYKRVDALSPFPVWLLFLHKDGIAKDTPAGMTSPTGVFGQSLAYLSTHEHHRHDNWARGMVYWGLETLRKLATLEELD